MAAIVGSGPRAQVERAGADNARANPSSIENDLRAHLPPRLPARPAAGRLQEGRAATRQVGRRRRGASRCALSRRRRAARAPRVLRPGRGREPGPRCPHRRLQRAGDRRRGLARRAARRSAHLRERSGAGRARARLVAEVHERAVPLLPGGRHHDAARRRRLQGRRGWRSASPSRTCTAPRPRRSTAPSRSRRRSASKARR